VLIGTVWYDPSWDDYLLVIDEDESDDPGALITYLGLDGKLSGKVEQMSKAVLHAMEKVF